jgi:hypothetical protein
MANQRFSQKLAFDARDRVMKEEMRSHFAGQIKGEVRRLTGFKLDDFRHKSRSGIIG